MEQNDRYTWKKGDVEMIYIPKKKKKEKSKKTETPEKNEMKPEKK